MPASATSKRGLGREAQAPKHFKDWAECPECNQSELTWASKPDCGIATTQKALTQDTAKTWHRTKDGTELAGCRPSPSGDRQPEQEGPEEGNGSPREILFTKLQTGLFAN